MKKTKINNILVNWHRYVVLALLLALWAILTLLYITSYDKSFVILSHNESKASFSTVTYDKLLANDKVSGSFTATEDNLGILTVRFSIFSRVPYKDEDVLMFRLKEKGSTKWYYQNTYRSGLIYEVPLFPFGFPKIANSKGKQYEFEIQSTRGNNKNAVALSSREPVLVSKYETSKAYLLSDKKQLFFFALKKFSALQTAEVLFASLIFLLPLIMYCFSFTPSGKKVTRYLVPRKLAKLFHLAYLNIFLRSIIILLIISNILFFQITYTGVYLVLIGVWIFILRNNDNTKISYIVALIFLLCSIVFYYMYLEYIAELVNAWTLLFLFAGVVHSIIVYKRKEKRIR